MRPVDTERVIIKSGAGANNINAAGFTHNLIVDAGAGADTIVGGGGRNILFGGLAADSITGGGSDDILIGNGTSLDVLSSQGTDLADEWFGTNSYANRVANIKAGTGAGPTSITMIDTPNDGAADTLRGNLGTDWFWAFIPNDVLLDRLAMELLR